jgi:adenine C2-methylase RlmN of 23S rRNA A2503 and tRNA A37
LQVNLAVSLHAATDELRNTLVPVNRRYPLDRLMAACHDYVTRTHRRISFEWALIGGVNDSLDQARALAERVRGLRVPSTNFAQHPERSERTGQAPSAGPRGEPVEPSGQAPSTGFAQQRGPSAGFTQQRGPSTGSRLYHVNLIPLNPTANYPGAPTSPAQVDAFRAELDRHGVPNTLRTRRGVDIQAGCGQLRQRRAGV